VAEGILVITEGPAAGTSIPLESELLIGRTAENEGKLGDDPELSRQHARVSPSPDGGLQIEDLGSTNGTFVNGQRVDGTVPIRPGDSVKVGTTTMQVLDPSGKAPARTKLGAAPPPDPKRTTAQPAPPPPAQPTSPPSAQPAPAAQQPAPAQAAAPPAGAAPVGHGADAQRQPPPARPAPFQPTPAPGGPGGSRRGGGGLIAAAAVLVLLIGGAGVLVALYARGSIDLGLASSPEEIVDEAGPGTVRIATRFRDIRQATEQARGGGGTGIVVDAEGGRVLTNEHVVRGASSIEVFKGGERSSARVVASAPCEDLAVIELDPPPDGLEALTFGDAEDLEAGDSVVALGFPSSLAGRGGPSRRLVATQGTVSVPETSSELGAELPRYRSLVQHQAPISGGNSGGPLLNESGEVVGVNTLRPTSASDIQGQSYSIQSNYVERLLPDLLAGEDRNDVGWNLRLAREIGLRGGGLINVDDSDGGSPADRAGIRFLDVIARVDGSSVNAFTDVCRVLNSRGPGDRIRVEGAHLDTGRPFSAQMRLR